MRSKVLITGSVMGSDNNSIKLYEQLEDICKEVSNDISSPIDTMKFKGNDIERYKRAMSLLEKTRIIIAEMSIPSTGQGMELQEAVKQNIPIVLIAKHGSKISGLIKGSGKLKDILYYNEINDIRKEIIKNIKKV